MTDKELNIIQQYSQLNYKKLKKLIIKDLNSNYTASSILLKKYSRSQIEKFLEAPDKNSQQLQEMSLFLYNVSLNYKRLIDYLCLLPTDNYWLSPNDTFVDNIELLNYFKELGSKIGIIFISFIITQFFIEKILSIFATNIRPC